MFCKAEIRTRGADYQLKQVPDKRLFLIDKKRGGRGRGGHTDKVEVSPGEIRVLYSHLLLAKTDRAAQMREREMCEVYGMKSHRTSEMNCIEGNAG